jgi:hypothetical protein
MRLQARSTALDDVEPPSYGMAVADRNANGVCLLTGGREQGSSEVWPDPLDPAYQEPPVVYEEPPKRAQQGGQQAQACYMQPPLPLMPGLVFTNRMSHCTCPPLLQGNNFDLIRYLPLI